jgi:glucose-1-phosphate cytidylyltransferase
MKNKNTEVVILCGGKGTRMGGETQMRPKPMVEIGGRPILWHIMNYYSHFGYYKFIIALGYKGGHIRKYFDLARKTCKLSGGAPWEITCVDTGLETLKGGRIKRLEPYIKGEVFHLTYGDGLSDIDINKLEAFHKRHGKAATVTAVRPPSRFGEMVLSGNKVREFEEKPQLATGHINGGFFVFNTAFLKYLTTGRDCDFEFGPLQILAKRGDLMAYRHEGYWQCMDTIRDAEYLNRLWISGSAPWKIWKR